MITIKLKGGLGNQMFQYALGKKLAEKNRTTLALDVAFLNDRTPRKDVIFRNYDLDIFQLDQSVKIVNLPRYIDPVSKIGKFFFLLKFKFDKNYSKEKHFQFDPAILNSPDEVYLDGQWTSEKYFLDIENSIRQDFTLKEPLLPISKDIANEITSTNSVCVNIRRGDFVANKITSTFHGVMNEDYFSKAIKILENTLTDPHFFVFSDDIEWCKENIKSNSPMTFVDHSHKGTKFGNYLRLMILCKHFIIPNSTFGWWAAWLSTSAGSQKKVIAPKQWFANEKVNTNDVIPSSWTRI